jgi:DNA-binding protein H-NS
MSIEVVAGKSVPELDELIAAAEAEKASAKERAIGEFTAKVEEIKALAESLGIKKIASYFGAAKPEKLYRDPNNAENTWSGKGPKPAWLKSLLDGKSKEEAKEAIKQYLVA